MTTELYKVSHGSYIIVDADGRVWASDCGLGPYQPPFSIQQPRSDWAIISFVQNYLKKPLSGIIITHHHIDHNGSLPWLLRHYQDQHPKPVLYTHGILVLPTDPPGQPHAQTYSRYSTVLMEEMVEKYGYTHHYARYGDKIGNHITVLGPMAQNLVAPGPGGLVDINGQLWSASFNDERNVIHRVEDGEFSILLTGDSGPHAGTSPVSRRCKGLRDAINLGNLPVKSTVMQVPHHGDYTFLRGGDWTAPPQPSLHWDDLILDSVQPELCILGSNNWATTQNSMAYLNYKNIDWVHFGAGHNRFRIRGESDGSWTVSADVPRNVPMTKMGGA